MYLPHAPRFLLASIPMLYAEGCRTLAISSWEHCIEFCELLNCRPLVYVHVGLLVTFALSFLGVVAWSTLTFL